MDGSIIKAYPLEGLFMYCISKGRAKYRCGLLRPKSGLLYKNTTDFSTDSIHIVGVFFSVASLGLGPTTIKNSISNPHALNKSNYSGSFPVLPS